jgi:hypothetical protein
VAAATSIRYLQREELLPLLDAPAQASKPASQPGIPNDAHILDRSLKIQTPNPQTQQLPRVLAALRAAADASGEEGPEWAAAFRALDDVRRLVTHHPKLFSPPQAQQALRDAGRLGDSLR